MEAVNIRAALELADYAVGAGAKSFVYLSTGGVYRPSDGQLRETTQVAPQSFYAATKAAAEILLSYYSELLNVIILRPFFVYGPGQTGMLIPTLISKVAAGQEVLVSGPDGMRSNPTYVDDAVDMIELSLQLESSATLNIAGTESLSIREIVREIGHALGKPVKVASRPTEGPVDLVPDLTLYRSKLGSYPATSFSDGIARTCEAMGLSVARER